MFVSGHLSEKSIRGLGRLFFKQRTWSASALDDQSGTSRLPLLGWSGRLLRLGQAQASAFFCTQQLQVRCNWSTAVRSLPVQAARLVGSHLDRKDVLTEDCGTGSYGG